MHTTLRVTGKYYADSILVRADLSQSLSAVEVQYDPDHGWQETDFSVLGLTRQKLADIGGKLLARWVDVPEDEFPCTHAVVTDLASTR